MRKAPHSTGTVQGAHRGDSVAPGGRAMEKVRSISVGVQDVRLDLCQNLRDSTPFPEIVPPSHFQANSSNPGRSDRTEERIRLRSTLDHRDHRDLVAAASESSGDALNHALESSHMCGRAHEYDGEGP
jgi:hypothetical protein